MNLIMPPGIPSLEIGGRVFTDLQNLIQLVASVGTTAANGNASARLANGVAGYQVPVGKILTLQAFRAAGNITAGAAIGLFALGYSDNDAGQQSNNALTNAVYIAGTNTGPSIPPASAAAVVTSMECPLPDFQVPAGKYISLVNQNNAYYNVYLFGYLKNA